MYLFHNRTVLPLNLNLLYIQALKKNDSEGKRKFKLNYPAVKLILFLFPNRLEHG